MQAFTYTISSSKIIFGQGSIVRLPDELKRLGIERPLIITTPQQATQGHKLLEVSGMPAGVVCSQAVMHTPTEVTESALAFLKAQQCDGLVAIGGGSTIGLSKALAIRSHLPQIAIPTTYAGSEVTSILGETQNGVKKTLRSAAILPNAVIYDVNFTIDLPVEMSSSSGLNALAHAAEALYARDTNPVVNLMAEEGIRALAISLPDLMDEPTNLTSRTQAQYGAWLCGTCLGSVAMSLHHKLCHVLGGAFNLPHAQTHSVVLPYALAYNAPNAQDAMTRIAKALGNPEIAPSQTLYELLRILRLPTSLASLGMPASGIEHALELVFKDAYWNPRLLERDSIRKLLVAAHSGATPIDY